LNLSANAVDDKGIENGVASTFWRVRTAACHSGQGRLEKLMERKKRCWEKWSKGTEAKTGQNHRLKTGNSGEVNSSTA
jgi:hypothetical protein